MSFNGKSMLSGDASSKKSKAVDVISSTGPMKLNDRPVVSSGLTIGDPHSKIASGEASVCSSSLNNPTGNTGVSSGVSIGEPKSKKPNGPTFHKAMTRVSSGSRGKAVVSTGVRGKSTHNANVQGVMSLKDVKYGPQEGEATVIQGFIPPGLIETYLPHMRRGAIYKLNKFFRSNNKTSYRVADTSFTITFSWNSVLSVVEDSSTHFPNDHFRFHGYEEFEAACDLKGDLYDYVGHIKLVNGQVLSDSLVLDEAEIASTRRVSLHVQTHDGPVMKLNLWDKAAYDFSEKFRASGSTGRVILVTTLNPIRFRGTLSLCSMSPSRVFMDSDVQATRDYLTWLNSNFEVANRVRADIVTKPEPATIGELFSFMKQTADKVAWFECTATINDVVHGSVWYYIGCVECHTKAIQGPTTFMCKKCGKSDIIAVPRYLAKISVHDDDDQAVFVLLGDVGHELTGEKASKLVERYFEANESRGEDHLVPVPQALIDTIGQNRKFIVKVSGHNFPGKTQSLTVTKVLPPDAAEREGDLEGNTIEQNAQESLQEGVVESGTSTGVPESVCERVKRDADIAQPEDPKRAKCG